jgi:formylmethanofuran dehydrogenase subunit E
MTTTYERHICQGRRCDICDELSCPDRFQTIDGLDICAVCAWRLGQHDDVRDIAVAS